MGTLQESLVKAKPPSMQPEKVQRDGSALLVSASLSVFLLPPVGFTAIDVWEIEGAELVGVKLLPEVGLRLSEFDFGGEEIRGLELGFELDLVFEFAARLRGFSF